MLSLAIATVQTHQQAPLRPRPKPTRIEFDYQGPGVVECTFEDDECDLDEGPRCSNLNWKLIEKGDDAKFNRFGTEGIVKFRMTSEDCEATCTDGCGFTPSGAVGMSTPSLLVTAGLSLVMAFASVV